MPKLILSDEELNNILVDYNNGMSMNDIGKKYHHNHNTAPQFPGFSPGLHRFPPPPLGRQVPAQRRR